MLGMTMMPFLMAPLLLGLLVIYILGAYPRNAAPETNLGARVYLGALGTICAQVMLLGFAMFFVALVEERFIFGRIEVEQALALISGALVAGALPLVLWRMLGMRMEGQALRRVIGLNALITGLLSTFLIIVFFVALFDGADVLAMLLVTVVYSLGSVGFAIMLKNMVQDASGGAAE